MNGKAIPIERLAPAVKARIAQALAVPETYHDASGRLVRRRAW